MSRTICARDAQHARNAASATRHRKRHRKDEVRPCAYATLMPARSPRLAPTPGASRRAGQQSAHADVRYCLTERTRDKCPRFLSVTVAGRSCFKRVHPFRYPGLLSTQFPASGTFQFRRPVSLQRLRQTFPQLMKFVARVGIAV